jgi:hypothetical protein
MAETVSMLIGVPILLFVVLALSVELIEYRPSQSAQVEPHRGTPHQGGALSVPIAQPMLPGLSPQLSMPLPVGAQSEPLGASR